MTKSPQIRGTARESTEQPPKFAVFGLSADPGSTDAEPLDEVRAPSMSPRRRALRRFSLNPLGMIALGYLALMIVVAVFGDQLMPHDPNDIADQPFLGPSAKHWLGTDDLGRDVASRLINGAAVSVRAGYQSVSMALVIAIPIGLIAGYCGRWIDGLLMRIMDAMMSFPALILALVIAAILGPGLGNAMLAITVVLIPGFVRVIRGSTLAVKQETFVEASHSIGTPAHVILRRRILPAVLSPIIVTVSLVLGAALTAEAALSFLGLGTQAPNASWGNMLQRAYAYLFSHPFLMVPPGVAIALAVLSFNIVGDALRDALGFTETRPPRGVKRGRLGLTVVAHAARQRDVADGAVDGDRSVVSRVEERLAPIPTRQPLLSVRNLKIDVATQAGSVTLVDDVSFDIDQGEIVGLVGESGSGKSVTSMSIMRLLPSPPVRVSGGQVLLEGRDLLQLSFRDMVALRGKAVSIVFQDPMSSLNPAFTIGNQLVEAIRLHQPLSRKQAAARALELLGLVRIPDPRGRMKEYPHRLSGGMRQRVLIAMALANEPKLLIADEPTTALDVTVQAQILDLLKSLQRDFDMAMIFVSHDLGVIADIADRALVMYAGEIVETASIIDLFDAPRHPYTRKLLSAIPQAVPKGLRLPSIPGVVPSPGNWPVGCRFASRCDIRTAACLELPIEVTSERHGHSVRCLQSRTVEPALK